MIIHFPNLETLRLALAAGAIPPSVAQEPARAGFGKNEQLWVETSLKLPAATQRELKRFGASVCKTNEAERSYDVSCWLQLLPLVPDPLPPHVLEQTPVLFDIPNGEELSRLALEILRLGNDRQSYRWLEESSEKGQSRALLRVVGPPYYSLLRAVDQLGGPGIAPRAFLEQGPGVWVEIGYRHPLTDNIRPHKDKLLLLRPPTDWLVLPTAPFHDIFAMIEFHVPEGKSRWQDHALPHRLPVTPRLQQAGPAEGAELWVLRGAAVLELNHFVQNAEDQLLGRLAFAVGEKDGETVVVLRVRQAKQSPPVLVLPAQAYKSYLKIPNLFLPVGHILHPPLRRDVVRKLLAEDAQAITWLTPGEKGQFTPQSLPEDSFRPLLDWVEYVLDRDSDKLHAWIQAMRFDFESFICDEDQPNKPKKPPTTEKSRKANAPTPTATDQGQRAETIAVESTPEAAPTEEAELDAFLAFEKGEPSAIEQELHAVEEEFLALPGSLEDAAHQELWPRLANLNTRLQKTEDAALCWLHVLWQPGSPAVGDVRKQSAAWFRSEAVGAAHRPSDVPVNLAPWIASIATAEGVRRDVSGNDLDALFAVEEPLKSDVRALAAYLTWASSRNPRPAPLMGRLPAVQRFLEQHEKLLPVRACWLAWYHLVQLLDGDILALARARDRLLERLFQQGLRPELDLPGFLRSFGPSSDRRGRGLGQWLLKLHERARRWVDRQQGQRALEYKGAKTKDYIDLIFAFGLARLGEYDASQHLLLKAQRELIHENEAHGILFRFFDSRVRQALEGSSTLTPLEGEPLERLNELRQMEEAQRTQARREAGSSSSPLSYIIDKMRGTSKILEPLQKLEEYRYIKAGSDEILQALAQLPDVKDRKELDDRIKWLLKKGKAGLAVHVQILKAALEQSPRMGEAIAQQLLQQALRAYDNALSQPASAKEEDRPQPETLLDLLERGLFVAAHFGRADLIEALMTRFRQLLRGDRATSFLPGFDHVVDQCLRGLRKLGLGAEIEELLNLMAEAVLKKQNPMSLLGQKDAGLILRTMLPIAAAWYDFGQDVQAEPIYQAARLCLFRKDLAPTEHLHLACAYAKALAALPVPLLQERLEELMEKLEGIPNTSSYGNFYSPTQIKLIETAMLAVLSEEYTQGAPARRWLDEEEYVIRRRMHADVRELMHTRGV